MLLSITVSSVKTKQTFRIYLKVCFSVLHKPVMRMIITVVKITDEFFLANKIPLC